MIKLQPNGWQLFNNGVPLDSEEESLRRLGANRFPKNCGFHSNENISEKPAQRAHATNVAWTGDTPLPG